MSKVVLITGANSGVGFELARLVAEKGHIVYLGARNEESGKKAVDTLHSEGLKTVKLVLVDVTQPSSIKRAKETIEAAEGKLDVLVNNAGICQIDANQSAASPSMDVVREIMETNFYGAIETTVAKTPVILNVASALASNKQSQADGRDKFVGYRASKVALNSYTIALALELKDEGFKNTGQPVEDGGLAMLPWALLDSDGPTGKFFGPGGQEVPW
ncbi:hypothetical protein BJ912DRAFT_1046430 [Pholiota molesta]|nr:hypothetical protein BJ912DRAFT_1046430 [Pholiota molesta]